jgi:hypothetical protein
MTKKTAFTVDVKLYQKTDFIMENNVINVPHVGDVLSEEIV